MTAQETIGRYVAELVDRMQLGQICSWTLQHRVNYLGLEVELPVQYANNGHGRFRDWEVDWTGPEHLRAEAIAELLGEALEDLARGNPPKHQPKENS